MEEQISAVKEEGGKEPEEKNLISDNAGIGVIEIVLILVIIIGLVLIFKNQITAIVDSAFRAITGDASSIVGKTH